jgi:hypothetical protein
MKRLEGHAGDVRLLRADARGGYEPEGLHRFSDRFVINNLTRLAASARLRDSRLGRVTWQGLAWLFARPGAIRDYCAVLRARTRVVPVG